MKRNQEIAAIYARTSKDVDDGFSVKRQVREMLDYAQKLEAI